MTTFSARKQRFNFCWHEMLVMCRHDIVPASHTYSAPNDVTAPHLHDIDNTCTNFCTNSKTCHEIYTHIG